jgi:hypothetical protein
VEVNGMFGRLAALGSILLALAGCDRGRLAGVGVTCGPTNACASFLVCVAGRCQPPSPRDAEAGPDEPVPDANAPRDPPDVPAARPEPNDLPRVFSFALTSAGQLWMQAGTVNTRLPTQDPGASLANLADVVPGPGIGPADDVETQAIGPEVNVLARAFGVAYVTSLRGKIWTPWSPLTSSVRTMGLANLGGALAACLVDSDGRLRLGTRSAAGIWTELRDVTDAAMPAKDEGEAPRPFIKIDCAGFSDTLELVGIDETHALWSAAVRAGDWRRWERVESAKVKTFRDADASNAVGVLHVLASTVDTQYHLARAPGGSWAPVLADVQELTAYDPPGTVVAGAQASVFTDLVWSQVTSAGKIWGAFRSVNSISGYFPGSAWPENTYVNVASTTVLP